jgi:hypothetical protein
MHSTCLTHRIFCMRLTNCVVLTKKKSGVNFLCAVGCNFHCAIAPGFLLCSPRRCSLAKQITSMQDTSTVTSRPNRPATLIGPVFTYQSLRAKWYKRVAVLDHITCSHDVWSSRHTASWTQLPTEVNGQFHTTDTLHPEKEPLYPFHRTLEGPPELGRGGKEENMGSCDEFFYNCSSRPVTMPTDMSWPIMLLHNTTLCSVCKWINIDVFIVINY